MVIANDKPLSKNQEEFLKIKCALQGAVDGKCCKDYKTWKLPDLNPHLLSKTDYPCEAQKDHKKSGNYPQKEK